MHALDVLEFESIRERLAQHAESSLAVEWSRALMPSFDGREVERLLALTAEADFILNRTPVPSLVPLRDYRDPLKRAHKGGVLGGQELAGIGEALGSMRNLKAFLARVREEAPLLSAYADALPEQPKLEQQLNDSLEPDGTVRDEASVALGQLRQRKKSTQARMVEKIQSYTTGRYRDYLSDPIYTVREGRYVVPVKSEHRGKIKGIVHDTSASGQTIFVEPEEVLQLGNALREIETREREEITKVLTALSGKVGAHGPEISGGIEAGAAVDFAFSKARYGHHVRGALPEKAHRPMIEIEQGKHPLLDPDGVVPLDLTVGMGKNVLITGPNTGGKTVAIKTVGLFAMMMQCGLMVPARRVVFGPFSQVWADIGDEQSLQQSLSTFGGHIKNIAEALRGLMKGALVLLDEVGAGTDPAEGAALAKSILLALQEGGATILASTHYGELKAFAYNVEGFANAAMEFDGRTLRPTYRLIMGAPGASHALKIAERYGIPKPIIERAKEGLGEQAQDIAEMMEQLEQAQRRARTAQSEADRRSSELRKAEERAARKLREADEIRSKVYGKAQETIEAALREIRLEASDIFENLKKDASPKALEAARKRLKDLQEAGSSFASEFDRPASGPSADPAAVVAGATVRIRGHLQTGTVVNPPDRGKVLVQVGMLKMTVPVSNVEVVQSQVRHEAPSRKLRFNRAQTATTEIMLINKRFEDAQRELEKFIDEAVLGGLPFVRIVHGKGEGILRQMTRDLLKSHPGVASYRDGDPAEGGHGVTIANFS